LGAGGVTDVGAAAGQRRRGIEDDLIAAQRDPQQLGLGTHRPAAHAAPLRRSAYDACSSPTVSSSPAPVGSAASGAGSRSAPSSAGTPSPPSAAAASGASAT